MNRKIIIPDTWMGESLEGAIERALSSSIKPAPRRYTAKATDTKPTPANIDNPKNWLILEGRTHGSYGYNDLLVSIHRLGYNPSVETAAKTLNLSFKDSAKEEHTSIPYIGDIKWESAVKLNLAIGNQTLDLRQGMDLISDLRNASRNKKNLYNGKGEKVDSRVLEVLYNEIWGKRDPWRAEWLDTRFVEEQGTLYVEHGHTLDASGNLVYVHKEPLEECLKSNNYFSIRSINRQGLPTKTSSKDTYYFGDPSNGSVARFVADSGRAGLVCDWYPQDADAGLGVRPVRKKN